MATIDSKQLEEEQANPPEKLESKFEQASKLLAEAKKQYADLKDEVANFTNTPLQIESLEDLKALTLEHDELIMKIQHLMQTLAEVNNSFVAELRIYDGESPKELKAIKKNYDYLLQYIQIVEEYIGKKEFQDAHIIPEIEELRAEVKEFERIRAPIQKQIDDEQDYEEKRRLEESLRTMGKSDYLKKKVRIAELNNTLQTQSLKDNIGKSIENNFSNGQHYLEEIRKHLTAMISDLEEQISIEKMDHIMLLSGML